MNKGLKTIHGHTVSSIEDLLQEQLSRKVSIADSAHSLGGWSNINLPVDIDDSRFVLKLPPLQREYLENPYSHQYYVLEEIRPLEIAPVAIEIGRFDDRKRTPFLLLEYIEGEVYSSIERIDAEKMDQLSDVLSKLNGAKVPIMDEYTSAARYLSDKLDKTRGVYRSMKDISRRLEAVAKMLFSLEDKVHSSISNISWRKAPLHGDLQETNIVFGNNDVYLLDFEESFIGDPVYDYCYFFLQNPENSIAEIDVLSKLITIPGEELLDFAPLVLAVLVAWSIERLCHSEMGIISPHLSTPKSYDAVLGYAKSKLTDLRNLVT